MSDAEQIAARRQDWMTAFEAEDIPAMSAFVTEDHLVMAPNQPQRVGLQATQDFWREGFAAATTTMDTHTHTLTVAGDVAVDRFEWTQRITLNGQDQTLVDQGICVWIWQRGTDGTWRISSAIWNSDLAEPGVWSGS